MLANFTTILFLAIATLVVSGLSFLAGMLFEKWYLASALKRATKKLSKLVELVAGRTELAAQACRELARVERSRFTTSQMDLLTKTQLELAKAFEAVIAQNLAESAEMRAAMARPVEPLHWQLTPVDELSGLPDHTCCEGNLKALLDQVDRGLSASLLLLQIDKFPQLFKRHGALQTGQLVRSLGKLLIGSSREIDVVCQSTEDLLVILMPDANADIAGQTADTIRHAVRSQRFRLVNSQQEILMTASFGLALLKPGDDVSLALGRAHAALSESRRYGRNQLHVHDGGRTTLFHAG